MSEKPTHIDLFSGIGGFALAAAWAGFRTVVFCERDAFCQKILAQHWPAIPIEPDIFGMRGDKYAGADLLTAGFPCQPFSQAGKRRGKEDDRYLWPEVLRVVSENRPCWFIGENVAGLDGLGLDDCISNLESISYEVAPPLEIPACAVDTKHIRNRIWIVAYSGRNRRDRRRERERGGAGDGEGTKSEWLRTSTKAPGCREALANASGSGREKQHAPCESDSQGLYTGSNAEGWREWPVESGFCRVAHGIPNRTHRLKGLGNAIVPQVAYQIIKEIRKLI